MTDDIKSQQYEILKLKNQICFPLYACAKEVTRSYRKPLEELGLTYTQYIVMLALWEFGDMSESQIGEKVHLDSGTLTPLLKRLEKQGLLKRKRDKEDERQLIVALTAKGKALREKALKIPGMLKGCIDLSDKELIQLKKLLDKALKRMEEN